MSESILTKKILVTSYLNPDLDGVASVLAYAYLLNKKGFSAEVILFGKPQPEVEYFRETLGYKLPVQESSGNSGWDSFVIVDTSSSKRLPKFIDPNLVLEIIDHHPAENGKEFPKAKIQNEEVGAAATLVYERILKENFKLDENLAILLYAAIFHNSSNLLSGTQRDLESIAGLEKEYGLKRQSLDEMFGYADKYTLDHLEEVVLGDLKEVGTNVGQCVAGQVEIYGTTIEQDQIKSRLSSLAEKLGRERGVKVLMIMTDLKVNRTAIYSSNLQLQEKISEAFKIEFNKNWAQVEPMLLRKKILKAIA